MMLPALATIGLAADCLLTVSDKHNGVDAEINPVLRGLWKLLGKLGVWAYFAAWIFVVWNLEAWLGGRVSDPSGIASALQGAAILASIFGVASILRNQPKVSEPED